MTQHVVYFVLDFAWKIRYNTLCNSIRHFVLTCILVFDFITLTCLSLSERILVVNRAALEPEFYKSLFTAPV